MGKDIYINYALTERKLDLWWPSL